MFHLTKKAKLRFSILNYERTSLLIYGEFFHGVNKLPEFLISTFCNKLTGQEKKWKGH